MPTTINPSNQTINEYAVQSGGANNNLNNISPGTTGYALTSNGASAQPSFQVLPVSGGGTGGATAVPYEVVCGGTTSTNPFQQVSGTGTAGQVLTSVGAGALPTWQDNGGGSITVLTASAVPVSAAAFSSIYDFTGLNFALFDLRISRVVQGGGGNGGSVSSYTGCYNLSASAATQKLILATAGGSSGVVNFSGNILQANVNASFNGLLWWSLVFTLKY